jgi:hypothetical protein
VEDHEVGAEDLIQATQQLEAVQLVLTPVRVDASGFGGKRRARRMNELAASLEQSRHGRLGQPMDLQSGDPSAQFACDRHITPRVPQADG